LEKEFNGTVDHFYLARKDSFSEGVKVTAETVTLSLVEPQEGFLGVEANIVP
jgi:hypothetical protein